MNKNFKHLKTTLAQSLLIMTLLVSTTFAAPIKTGDPHYNKVGFFDIHVCNWPDRPLFFMTLFSTYDYKNVVSIDVIAPDKRLIKRLSLSKFRVVKSKSLGEKRVFINQIEIEKHWPNGWYTSKVIMKDGSEHLAKDYVIIDKVGIVDSIEPINNAEEIKIPNQLQWQPTEGAALYQVFIRDLWNDGKLIYKSPLVSTPKLNLPKDLIQADGWYSWMIHARDGNKHVLLGDFNHGSLSPEYKFTTAP